MHLTTLFLSLVIVYVKENGPIGEGVMKLTATDADSGNNAKISYSIIAGNSASMFTIDRTSGAINTSAPIDYERKVSYNLTVSASDSVYHYGNRACNRANVQGNKQFVFSICVGR